MPFSEEVTKNTISYLMLALISILFSFYVVSLLNKKRGLTIKGHVVEYKNQEFIFRLRRISKLIFYITLLPTVYLIIDKILFSLNSGYIETYLSYSGGPILISRLSHVNLISVYMFLATMPTKKESRLIIFIYLFYSLLTIFQGARATAVVSVLIILFYFFYRNHHDRSINNGEVWVSKKQMLLLILFSPIVISFLSFWRYFRVNENLDNFTFTELFFGFFASQGGSVNIISYAQLFEFPDTNLSYTFGPLIFFLRNNIFSKIFLGTTEYLPHTVDMALYGNNLAHTITYFVMPHNYLAGIGMGSNYIAELFIDFGVIGIIIFNFVIGIVLYYINNINVKKPWLFTVYLLMLNSILTMPRSSALNWIMDVTNITTLVSILFFYILARVSFRKKVRHMHNNDQRSTFLKYNN